MLAGAAERAKSFHYLCLRTLNQFNKSQQITHPWRARQCPSLGTTVWNQRQSLIRYRFAPHQYYKSDRHQKPVHKSLIDQQDSAISALGTAMTQSVPLAEVASARILVLVARHTSDAPVLLHLRALHAEYQAHVAPLTPPAFASPASGAIDPLRCAAAVSCAARLAAVVKELSTATHSLPPDHADRQLAERVARRMGALELVAAHVRDGVLLDLPVSTARIAGVDVRDVVCELASLFARGHLSFPWKRLHYVDGGQAMMAALKDFVLRIDTRPCSPQNIAFLARAPDKSPLFPLRFQAGYVTFVHDDADYERMDVLVDLFNEEPRLHARRQDAHESPLASWTREGFVDRIVSAALERDGVASLLTLRERFYAAVKECTQFKPSLAVAVIKYFHAKAVLDFSAGWGDRLAGAIAAGVTRYHAFDPNTRLRQGHRALIAQFVPPEQQERFTVTYEGVEAAAMPDGTFDLVFTSPPFFDFEIYTGEPGQSVDKFRSLTAWLARPHSALHSLMSCRCISYLRRWPRCGVCLTTAGTA